MKGHIRLVVAAGMATGTLALPAAGATQRPLLGAWTEITTIGTFAPRSDAASAPYTATHGGEPTGSCIDS